MTMRKYLFLVLLFLPLYGPISSANEATTNPVVKLETSHGDITLELYPDKAPLTVENFLGYVDSGYYNGTIFHRVIKDFMIQGGGFNENFFKKPTLPAIKNEADNGLTNERGTIAMARTGDPHSATSQFFINHINNTYLNFKYPSGNGWGYCVFGKVTSGMDIVDKISAMATGSDPKGKGMQNVPSKAIIIKSASRVTAESTPSEIKSKKLTSKTQQKDAK